MTAPKIPINENERLSALREYAPDAYSEAAFDDLTLIAAEVCNALIALITLVDEKKVWSKSEVGLTKLEAPRELTFCGHAILSPAILIVEDAQKDERFQENPFVTGNPNVRFYAGAVLKTPSGHNIGAFCVIDYKPRQLSETQIKTLEALARRVIAGFERKRGESTIKEQQAKLLNAAKYSALGEMAAGIAHEVNSPLAIIKGKSSQLKKIAGGTVLDRGKLTQELEKIVITVDRIAKIIQGLQSYSRSAANDPMEMADLGQIITDTVGLCSEKMRISEIELRLPSKTSVKISCRAAQISQILMNLINNAFDAVQFMQKKWIELKIECDETQVRILVIDSGTRITPAVKSRMMDPFFTTKEVGKGTGLGLSISMGLAESHGGSLAYDPSHAQTCFVVELPISQTVTIMKAAA